MSEFYNYNKIRITIGAKPVGGERIVDGMTPFSTLVFGTKLWSGFETETYWSLHSDWCEITIAKDGGEWFEKAFWGDSLDPVIDRCLSIWMKKTGGSINDIARYAFGAGYRRCSMDVREEAGKLSVESDNYLGLSE